MAEHLKLMLGMTNINRREDSVARYLFSEKFSKAKKKKKLRFLVLLLDSDEICFQLEWMTWKLELKGKRPGGCTYWKDPGIFGFLRDLISRLAVLFKTLLTLDQRISSPAASND